MAKNRNDLEGTVTIDLNTQVVIVSIDYGK